jgi:hypothetical protein
MQGIYKILNTVTNKVYIGSTFDFKTRKRIHLKDLRNNKHHSKYLQNSYNKYGEDIFVFEILEIIEDNSNLLIKEQYWINYFQSFDEKKGYNILKFAGSCKGRINTEKRRLEISIQNSKPIYQYDLNGNFIKEWRSATIAAKELNTFQSTINNALTNYAKTALGYMWKYDKMEKIEKYQRKKNKPDTDIVKNNKIQRILSKTVQEKRLEKVKNKVCLINIINNSKIYFNSQKEASLFLNVSPTTILKKLNENVVYNNYKLIRI